MPMHTDFARPEIRRWLSRNKPRTYHLGDDLVLIFALLVFLTVIL